MGPFYFHVKEHILPCQHIREYPGATLNDQEDILKLHVKQYKPKDPSQDQPGAVTIIGAHANAFPKVRERHRDSFSLPNFEVAYRSFMNRSGTSCLTP